MLKRNYYVNCRCNCPVNCNGAFLRMMIYLSFILFFGTIGINAQSGYWTELKPLTSPSWRGYFNMINDGDGKVLLFGGLTYMGNTNELWLFDLNKNNWYIITPKKCPQPRMSSGFAKLNDSLYILYGGEGDSIYYYNDTWILNMNDTSWTQIQTKNIPPARADMGFESIDTNIALLFGGKNPDLGEGRRDTWIFEYEKKEWREIIYNDPNDHYKLNYPERRIFHSLTKIDKGKAILYGGSDFKYLDDIWMFDLTIEKWKKILPVGGSSKRMQHGLCYLGSKYLLVFGGTTIDSLFNIYQYTDETLLFDIDDSVWIKMDLDIKPSGKRIPGLARITENKALLFAGESVSNTKNDTWLFTLDPVDVKEEEKTKEIKFIQTSNYLIIKNIDESGGELYIYDIMGRAISNYSSFDISKSDEIRIPISHLNSGIYLLRIDSQIEKFIIIK